MEQSERNLMVLENFILYLTQNSDTEFPAFTEPQTYTPEELYRVAYDYIEEDHVDGEDNTAMENITEIKTTAKNLINADGGENIEYARGICEFIADLDGIENYPHADRTIEIARELEVEKQYYNQFY